MTHQISSVTTYTICYVLLLLLLALTYVFHDLDLGAFNLPVALAISVAKSAIVLLFFMHLRQGRKLHKIYALVAVFWLLLLFVLSLADFLTRDLA